MKRILALALVIVFSVPVVALGVALHGSPLSPVPPSDDADDLTGAMETVWWGQHVSFGYETPAFMVIQSQSVWESLWARAGREAPEVDLAERTILVAIHGETRTGGYDIEIRNVTASNGELVVSVILTQPGPSCGTPQVLTYPVHMVSIPKASGPWDFQRETVVHECA